MNFNSRFFRQGFNFGKSPFQKFTFKGYFNVKKDINNLNQNKGKQATFILNKLQKMDYLTFQTSMTVKNSLTFLANDDNSNTNLNTSTDSVNLDFVSLGKLVYLPLYRC